MMNRRDILKSIGVMVGGAFCGPTLLAMDRWENQSEGGLSAENLNLSENQKNMISDIAEIIIPETTTPGARQAGVPAFIVMMLQDCYRKPEHVSFMRGLEDLEKRNFLALKPKERTELLKTVEAETVNLMKEYSAQQAKLAERKSTGAVKGDVNGVPFWRLMKELTLLSSQYANAFCPGMKASFDYVPIPGKLELVSLKPGQKAFAY